MLREISAWSMMVATRILVSGRVFSCVISAVRMAICVFRVRRSNRLPPVMVNLGVTVQKWLYHTKLCLEFKVMSSIVHNYTVMHLIQGGRE